MLAMSSTVAMCHGLTGRYNNDNKQDDDADDEAHAHLHVLPPHLLAHAVGPPSQALGRLAEVVRLVLQRVQACSSLRGFVDVGAHDADGAVDFLVNESVNGSAN